MITKKILVLIFMLCTVFVFCKTAEEFAAESDEAVKAENMERALELLREGIKQYPKNDTLPFKLGLIYHDKELYGPAYKIFKKGLSLNPDNISILYYISSAAASLNKPEEALYYIKKYLQYVPDDRFAAANYGWLCFKCHKETEGIEALLKNMERYGEDSSVCNSLATLYSEMYEYTNAEKFYSKAIKIAKMQDRNYSASLYSYNKSILERQFYNFDKSLDAAKEALRLQERNSSYMMIGELEERRNNFSEALAAYTAAATTDDTPLAALSIAGIYLTAGHTEKAEHYILSQLQNKNESWISNYGLSVTEFKSTLYELQKKLYEQKLNYEKTRITSGVIDFFKKIKNKIGYKLKYDYYDAMQRSYKVKAAKEFKKQSIAETNGISYGLRINGHYYLALKEKGSKALKYLESMERIETAVIPQSAGSYIAEKGICLKNPDLINEGIKRLEPEWEKFLLKDLYAEGAKAVKRKSRNLYYAYLESLYGINPSGFLEFDIKLPINLKIDIKEKIASSISAKKMKSIILSSRFLYDADSKFELQIIYEQNILSFKLINKNGNLLYSRNTPVSKLTKAEFKKAVNENVKDIFSVKL